MCVWKYLLHRIKYTVEKKCANHLILFSAPDLKLEGQLCISSLSFFLGNSIFSVYISGNRDALSLEYCSYRVANESCYSTTISAVISFGLHLG